MRGGGVNVTNISQWFPLSFPEIDGELLFCLIILVICVDFLK